MREPNPYRFCQPRLALGEPKCREAMGYRLRLPLLLLLPPLLPVTGTTAKVAPPILDFVRLPLDLMTRRLDLVSLLLHLVTLILLLLVSLFQKILDTSRRDDDPSRRIESR